MNDPVTYTYKQAEDCSIKADLYSAGGSGPRPAVMFIHGGCLMMGTRRGHALYTNMLVNAGYSVVSIDYRLAPETKLKAIIEDLSDAFKWVRDSSGQLNVDPDRIGVMGESAGGYLTLMSGIAVHPAPKVLVSIYGYGDVDGAWYSKPDAFYRKQPLVDESVARGSVGTTPLSETIQPNKRRLFYLYCRQNGLWPKEVAGYDPEATPSAFDPYCPVRNVTPSYPPTLLLHGDVDTDVPYAQSVSMAERLSVAGVPNKLVTVTGRGHGFDDVGFADPKVADALNQILPFMAAHLQ
jgi:acetyl esterase/lipase